MPVVIPRVVLPTSGSTSGFTRNDIAMVKLSVPYDAIDVELATAADDARTTAGQVRK